MKCYQIECDRPCPYHDMALDVRLGDLIRWCRNLEMLKAWKEREAVRLSTQNDAKTVNNIRCVAMKEGGVLYFVAEASPKAGKAIGRFMECVVEYDEEEDVFRLMANDSVLAEF